MCSPSCPFSLPDSNLNVSWVAQLGLRYFYRLGQGKLYFKPSAYFPGGDFYQLNPSYGSVNNC